MKKYALYIAIAMMLASCTDWLSFTPDKQLSEDNFFQTDEDAKAAIASVYANIFNSADEGFGRSFMYEIAGGGDDMIYGRTRSAELYRLVNFTYEGREVNGFNEQLANSLSSANWVVASLLRKSSRSAIENRTLGEAYFMRAFCHFFWAYRYGRADNGVPFDRYEDYENYAYGTPQQRATVMDNYALIIEDLEKAAELLPFFRDYSEADYGRAHRAAAWAYMVKTYAYWAQHDKSKWELIPALVDRIANEGQCKLIDKYSDVFTIAHNWDSEHIWSINCSAATNAGVYIACVPLENKGWGRINGWGYFKPTLGLRNEFVEGDQRRYPTMLEYGDEFTFFGETRRFYSESDLESGFMLAKYMDAYRFGEVDDAGVGHSPYVSSNSDGFTDLNIPLFRFAEALLFKAEALIMMNRGADAAKVLNIIAARAGLGDNKYSNATMADLKHERRCELACEYTDRFMDLKRWEDWDALRAPKKVRNYEDRANPDSPWTEATVDYEGSGTRNFNPAVHIVMPYNPDDVVKANGKLKQNTGY
ncbi:MAG: RagB/SusD family nutrient uptake outer membrane protein [Tannerellaceae bacterium]|jgi:hypothetical protein|nr:RagB/SusD family nutrient uptake outer membrane protein [Tannerellaceae bacterium]